MEEHEFLVSRDVKFLESEFPYKTIRPRKKRILRNRIYHQHHMTIWACWSHWNHQAQICTILSPSPTLILHNQRQQLRHRLAQLLTLILRTRSPMEHQLLLNLNPSPHLHRHNLPQTRPLLCQMPHCRYLLL